MMDFTPGKYFVLLQSFRKAGYTMISLEDYFKENLPGKYVILRHDVDRRISAAMNLAKLEQARGFRATYNFRYRAFCKAPDQIRKIFSMGHECGYHYEELARTRGNLSEARTLFAQGLEKANAIVPIRTIAMHGSPLSRFDNRRLCRGFDYKSLGIVGEVYLDVDYKNVFYLTDTGCLWNDRKYNLRDYADQAWTMSWKTTDQLIRDIEQLPPKLMLNIHPGRWISAGPRWLWEILWQRCKNVVKRILRPLIIR